MYYNFTGLEKTTWVDVESYLTHTYLNSPSSPFGVLFLHLTVTVMFACCGWTVYISRWDSRRLGVLVLLMSGLQLQLNSLTAQFSPTYETHDLWPSCNTLRLASVQVLLIKTPKSLNGCLWKWFLFKLCVISFPHQPPVFKMAWKSQMDPCFIHLNVHVVNVRCSSSSSGNTTDPP